MKLRDKLVTVVGLGKRTGVETVKFLAQKGAKIIVTDMKNKCDLQEELCALADIDLKLDLGGHSLELILKSDLIIISPGVPNNIPLLREAREKSIEIISEVELAYRFCKAPIIGITGTNGKTTTTTLIGEIFNSTDKKVVVGGNIGRPLIQDLPYLNQDGVVVAEVSSFQLEEIKDFRPKVSLVLNITPDHLDRHGSYEEYIKAKRRLLMNQESGDYTLLNYDDPIVREFANYTKGKVIFFSQREDVEEGVYLKEDMVISNINNQVQELIKVEEIGIKGPHNLENTLAAIGVSLLMGIEKGDLIKTIKEFTGVEHRIEEVGQINGVRYINDSKGTNPVAAIKALETFNEPIILIAGGKDKKSDFSEFAQVVVDNVKDLILLGETVDIIKNEVEALGYNNIHIVDSIKGAVKVSSKLAKEGDIVLLSPACASWDMFDSYEQRGRIFKEVVLKGKE
ncbi:UDP-N-acetylmuramoyl-L-alanine--D-glutamate ligase [Halonatronum saccharophilum]|uniref:UDP-N-acetylmuramoyl-L-alanine--D-glutamate ligase n=1 Tax=Halonatronum saccharophilum TaxID=150060 RepID=UPI0004B327E7|nr:UDP-N-acetylmuramoyl-L-alanine--D-glutamate ligase [Halonatronum saccharophilum]